VRRLYTMEQARAEGRTESEIRWAVRAGRARQIIHGVYGDGGELPTRFDKACAAVLRSDGDARGHLAGVLHGLDSVPLGASPPRRRRLPDDQIVVVAGIRCANGLMTLIDLASVLDDDTWEQALESALRKGLVTIEDIDAVLPDLARQRTPGVGRIRRVLAKRPKGAKATGSYLETLMVQVARTVPGLPDPERQYLVENEHGDFVAFVDLAWPPIGFFTELDGRGHEGQPEYDSVRETAVVAATGWLCGRFTWNDLHHRRLQTVRRLAAIAEHGRRRPMR